jgi:hypothetical protein
VINTPSPPCPICETGKGRWLELAWLDHNGQSSFICTNCGHFWTAPLLPERAKVLPFRIANTGREE